MRHKEVCALKSECDLCSANTDTPYETYRRSRRRDYFRAEDIGKKPCAGKNSRYQASAGERVRSRRECHIRLSGARVTPHVMPSSRKQRSVASDERGKILTEAINAWPPRKGGDAFMII